MIRRCEPLHEGDQHTYCGVMFDDARRMAVCPHVLLDGGDTVGIGPRAQPDVELERGTWAFEVQRDTRLIELVEIARSEARAAVRAADFACFAAVIAVVVAAASLVLLILGR